MTRTSAAALALSAEHLARVQELFLDVRKLRVESDAASADPLVVSRENIRRIKLLLVTTKKMRRHPRTQRVHEESHAKRVALEAQWETMLRTLSDHLVSAYDIDSAYQAAHRAWTTPPDEPADGVFALPPVTKFAQFRKALSKPKPSDMEAVSSWQGERASAAQLALKAAEEPGNEAYILRDANGNPIAVAAVSKTPKELHINVMAAAEGERNGTRMMQELAKAAKAEGLGIGLFSVPKARGFYEGLGMSPGDRAGQFSMTPEQVAAFAVTGGTYAPPGARQAGLTQAENAGAQQLALNALSGVPAGQSATVEDVKRALVAHVNEPAWKSGATTAYLGLATKTAEQAGQVSLDHLGLNKTFAFAHPQNMARATYGVRGSKVIDNMYGAHRDALTKIISDATDPRNPKTIAQVRASIKEQWPGLQTYQVERIARTETAAVWTTTEVNAYAANGISSFESIIATGPSIGVQTEDPCDECIEMASEVHSIDDDLPPWHPNCRCEAVPVLEDPETGDAWLPPDEPWTGGGEGSGPAEIEPRPAPEPPAPALPPYEPPPLPPEPEPTPEPAPEPAPEAPSLEAEAPFAAVLTAPEKQAVVDYTGLGAQGQDGYLETNRWLRGQWKPRGTNLARIKARVANLDSAIDRATPLKSEITVYRGIGNAEHYGDLKPGQVIEDKAFLSTSSTIDLPTSWAGTHGDIWTIKLPAGQKGIDVNAVTDKPLGLDFTTSKEKEIILPRGTRLVVDDVKERVTTYPNGGRVVAHDVTAHVETEPVAPPPEPPKAPEPAPEPPAAPTPSASVASTTTNPPIGDVDFRTPDGFQAMLAHYEGQTVRITFEDGRSYSGPVTRSARSGKMLLDRAQFRDSALPKIKTVEVKWGGRYKDWKEYETLGEPPAARTARERAAKPEEKAPEGGFKFEDAPPSRVIGDAPATPKFKSVAEAKAFAEQFIAREVDLGKVTDLEGLHQAMDGMAQVLRPYGLKLDRFHVERPKGQALAIFGRGNRRITINGVKQYWKGDIIQAQTRIMNTRDMAKANAEQQATFDQRARASTEAYERGINDSTRPEEAKDILRTKLANLKIAKRWIVAHSVDDPVRALLSHEAGHALDHAFGLRTKFAAKLKELGYTYQDGLALSEYGATEVAEIWAEVTAAKVVGAEIPFIIETAYNETLATVNDPAVRARIIVQAERDAKAIEDAASSTQKARSAATVAVLRKRVGLH